MKRIKVLLVLFSVGQLLFNLLKRRPFSVAEKRRQLACTVFADIAVLQLAVAEKSDFFSAYIAEFFLK